jgi:uncharacterized protein YbaR (Trm112 family)
MVIDKEILDLICCPNCQSNLTQNKNKFICSKCDCMYREKDGIIVLISKDLEDELRN